MLHMLYDIDNSSNEHDFVEPVHNTASSVYVTDRGQIAAKAHGRTLYSEEIGDSLLQSSGISAIVPTVAQYCQGEVINLANRFLSTLIGMYPVVLEGRKITLSYVDASNLFELTIADSTVLGMRRTAQKILYLVRHEATDSETISDLPSRTYDV